MATSPHTHNDSISEAMSELVLEKDGPLEAPPLEELENDPLSRWTVYEFREFGECLGAVRHSISPLSYA